MKNQLEITAEDVLSLWNQGNTANEIARTLSCSVDAVMRRLTRCGITDCHSHAEGATRHYRTQADRVWGDVRADADAGMAMSELKTKYHMTKSRIEDLFARHNYDYAKVQAMHQAKEQAALQQTLQDYRVQGLSVAEMAEKLSKSERTVGRYLNQFGLTDVRERVDITDERIQADWDAGCSIQDMANQYGCTHDAIAKRLDRLGITYDRPTGIRRHFTKLHENYWSDICQDLDCGYSVDFIAKKYHMRVSSVKRLMELHAYRSLCDYPLDELRQRLLAQVCPEKTTKCMFIMYRDSILRYYDNHEAAPTALQLADCMNVQAVTVRKNLMACGLCGYVKFADVSNYVAKLLFDFDDLGISYVVNDRRILRTKEQVCELDVYVPALKLGIEINPTFTHSVDTAFGVTARDYHQKKALLAEQCGIGLLHLYEDDFFDDVKYQRILRQIQLRYAKSAMRIGARMCTCKAVSVSDTRVFLHTYHFQGAITAKCSSYGLYYQDTLVSLLVVGVSRYTGASHDYELLRYCVHPGYAVMGGFEKLFSHMLASVSNSCKIVSYLDLNKRLSASNIYERFGFVFDKLVAPDYAWYHLTKHTVLSRYQTTKAKLVAKGYDGTKTEVEIMTGEQYVRVFRAGAKRYVYHHFV